MSLNISPFRFGYQSPQVRPAQSIQSPTWGPVDVSKQVQEGIAGILPALGKAYQATTEDVQRNKWADQVDAFGNRVDVNSPVGQAGAAVGLGQPGGPYAAQPAGGARPNLPTFA